MSLNHKRTIIPTTIHTVPGIYSIHPYYWNIKGTGLVERNIVHRFQVKDTEYSLSYQLYVEATDEIIAVLALLNNGYIIDRYIGRIDPPTPVLAL